MIDDDEELTWGMDVDADTGAPIMFAVKKPGQVAAQPESSGAVVFRGARSGNKNFDPVTGHFAGNKPKPRGLEVVAETIGAGPPVFRSGTPQGVDPLVWERRLDTVRDAARADEMMDPVSATQFLTGKVPDVTQVDMRAFLDDVMAQRISDAVDALDHAHKPRRERSDVNVKAPAGWVRRVVQELDTPQALHFVKRLEGKGWSPEDINKIVVSKIRDPERKKALQQLYGETKLPTEKTKEEVKSGQ
jgi:hypothetical protein